MYAREHYYIKISIVLEYLLQGLFPSLCPRNVASC